MTRGEKRSLPTQPLSRAGHILIPGSHPILGHLILYFRLSKPPWAILRQCNGCRKLRFGTLTTGHINGILLYTLWGYIRAEMNSLAMPIGGSRAQVAAIPYVQEGKCLGCIPCQARLACKSKALIQIDGEDPPFVDASRCFGCHTCIVACPAEAISLPRDKERES